MPIQPIMPELVIAASITIQIAVPASSATEGAEPAVILIGNKMIMIDITNGNNNEQI